MNSITNINTSSTQAAYTISSVISKDGTTIGYRQIGHGPGLIMLHGANVSGLDFTQLAEALADSFTIYLPDRRGRGLSGPFSKNYSIQEEIEDLTALVNKTGAHLLYGVSAGGLISLQAALSLAGIEKIALYEPAILTDGTTHTAWLTRFDQEMAEGKVAAALVTCMKGLELGGPVMNAMPNWLLESLTNATIKSEDKKGKPEDITMRKLAPTLHYDGLLLAEMSGKLESFRAVNAEVLLLGGSKGLPFLKPSLDALEKTLPHVAKRVEFPGLEHGGSNNPTQTNRGSKPELVAQELRQFFAKA
ncbi:alpha/beta hydrolase [Ktedonobacter sp. SOSP1-85]|uniref:alpha/beta fold hydrolase n=1 Tax=Ktedonobacter sp. SOSP1-85 TaxID=2778367 RepID=UPI001915A6AB|nr:alpha/beta hydrolase [Ktedonobacter sp. SOSP1-85]GHO80301.1 alpha/beta hydrolase [Ktedonobacter sp. SOSP1-85]